MRSVSGLRLTDDGKCAARHRRSEATSKLSCRQIGRSNWGSASVSFCKDDSEIPRSRTGFGRGISSSSSATERRSRALWLKIAETADRLRVILEVSELHLQCHGSPAAAGGLTVPPDLVDQRFQFGDHRIEFSEVAEERVLGTDGFADSVGPHGSLVDAARDPVK